MKPIEFKEQTTVYAKDQKPYLPLPAFVHNDEWECITSCWGLTLLERVKVLFTGRIYSTLPTWGKPLTPQKLEVNNPCKELICPKN